METIKFRCELLSDIILNQKAASEGPNQTLDFIPGSNFLGIVASELYGKDDYQAAMKIIHSGAVRFGDAHPSCDKVRGLKVPASMFYPKLQGADEKLYIHHYTDHNSPQVRSAQLKQCRSGFYNFLGDKAKIIETETNYAIKSAHDKVYRCSKDSQMYGYQSLQKGLELYFEVQCDEAYSEIITSALNGKKRIGRSRTAQYGLVEISPCEYAEIPSSPQKGKYIEVYADSRLIFLDVDGMTTYQPSPEQLGVEGGKINWSLSQVRTFQYSPWNFKRQCFDTDRCGIEKGSVFVIEGGECKCESCYVGLYQNEGFGKVIYNPSFLQSGEGGLSEIRFEKTQKASNPTDNTTAEIKNLKNGKGLLAYLGQQKQLEYENAMIYKEVSNFVEDDRRGGLFVSRKKRKLPSSDDEKFASQWGQIRSIAMTCKTYEELYKRLFSENGREGYLTHGKAKEKWDDKRKVDVVREFVEYFGKNELKYRACEDVVNLAAEMAKEMTRKANKKYGEER